MIGSKYNFHFIISTNQEKAPLVLKHTNLNCKAQLCVYNLSVFQLVHTSPIYGSNYSQYNLKLIVLRLQLLLRLKFFS